MRPLLFAAAFLVAVTSWPQGSTPTPPVREFVVVAEKFAFTPERIEVTQGERVRVTVRSADTTHGWAIEAFDVDVLARKGGRPETVEFVADRAGTFEITCSEYCGRGHKRMKGVFVVKPAGLS